MHSLTKLIMALPQLTQRVRTGEADDLYQQLEAKLIASYQKSPWQNVLSSWTLPDMRDR
jgi:hypothetical protein